ncbi:MAG TPA: hypothetical protein VFK05_33585 [Polyangiaceae bacterium]|nr:hypothetical protein [Polyangiaceae bacterium]
MLACDQRNLGTRARNQSLHFGVLIAGIGLGVFLLESRLGGARELGWLVALPMVAASYLVISGMWGICIVHALRGDRRADYGPEAILDPSSRSRMRMRAALALFMSIVIGFGLAAAFVVHG